MKKPIANQEAELQYLVNLFTFEDYGIKNPIASEAFFYDKYRWIHQAAQAALANREKADAVHVAEQLIKSGKDRDEVLNVVRDIIPKMSVSLGVDYSKLLNALFVKRQLKSLADQVLAGLDVPSSTTTELVGELLKGVNKLSPTDDELDFQSGTELGGAAIKKIIDDSGRDDPAIEFSTGCLALDRATCGYQRGCVWLVGAISHWGKSSHALMSAELSASQGKKVLIVSGEDALQLWGKRYASMKSGVTLYDIAHRTIGAEKLSDLASTVSKFSDNLFILDAVGMGGELAALHTDALVQRLGIDLVFIDYLKVFATKGVDEREQLNNAYDNFTTVIKKRNIAGVIYSQITPPPANAPQNGSKFYLFRGSKDIANRAEVALIGLKDEDGARMVELTKNKPGPLPAGETYTFKSNRKLGMFEPEVEIEFGAIEL